MLFPLPSEHAAVPRILRVTRCGAQSLAAPRRILAAYTYDDVPGVLDAVEREAAAGNVAAGFVAYDAAPAFDPALVAHRDAARPLAWFAICPDDPVEIVPTGGGPVPTPEWEPGMPAPAYRAALDAIRAWIAAGDTYQVNFTYPMRARIAPDCRRFFEALIAAQPTDYGWFMDTGPFAVLSVSPELFFRLDGDTIACKPMKGTAPRGLWYDDDVHRGNALCRSEKERAENVMIVDMVRNDLGRIAQTGTVRVTSLFDVERLDTCWQMTSAVEAQTRAGLTDIFRALFPSASVTGAPKVRTMQIIRALETGPRGVYCGAIGMVGPGRRAEFSVGIRTVTVDTIAKDAAYHVGSGITWDSAPQAELEECRLKAAVLTHRRPVFDLIESIRWDRQYWLLEEHLLRLQHSAAYFGFDCDPARAREALLRFARDLDAPAKVRLTLSRAGRLAIEAAPLGEAAPWRVALAPAPVDATNVFLYHKTTHRAVYEIALAAHAEADDVILWNERSELTESTRANIALRRGNEWFTPPVASGLLGGVYRAQLLREGALRERVLQREDLDMADEVRLINSVRGWIAVQRLMHPVAGRA